MTAGARDFAAALTAIASDNARSTAYYGNARGRPGVRRTRIVSSVGFMEGIRLTRVAPHATHVSRGEDRDVKRVVVQLYGLQEDARVLASAEAEDRNRVRDYDGLHVVVGDIDEGSKTLTELERMTGEQGPARHFLISRRGDLYIGAAIDDSVDPAYEDAVVIGLEAACAVPNGAFTERRVVEVLELPHTREQMDSFGVLLAKLRTAYPSIEREIEDPGVSSLTKFNFTENAWREVSPFDHTLSDWAGVDAVGEALALDLATEVFETPGAQPRAARAVAELALGEADTIGARSELLSQYAVAAGLDRSSAMQAATRQEFFVQRIHRAQAATQEASAGAARVQGATQVQTLTPPANVSPFVYDFATGRWQSGRQLPF